MVPGPEPATRLIVLPGFGPSPGQPCALKFSTGMCSYSPASTSNGNVRVITTCSNSKCNNTPLESPVPSPHKEHCFKYDALHVRISSRTRFIQDRFRLRQFQIIKAIRLRVRVCRRPQMLHLVLLNHGKEESLELRNVRWKLGIMIFLAFQSMPPQKI